MSRRARSLVTLLGGLLLGAMLMLVGLAQAGRLVPERPDALVALGQLLETEHRRVDLLLERGDVAGAIAALEALRAQRWPSAEEGGEAAMQMKHDAYGRLLRLRLDHPDVDPKRPDALLEIATEGLGEEYDALDVNPFTARMVALQGEVFELLDRDDDALGVYEEALDMNRTLLERELGGSGP
jgi:tetratricopeptide (TPR) repeat protein